MIEWLTHWASDDSSGFWVKIFSKTRGDGYTRLIHYARLILCLLEIPALDPGRACDPLPWEVTS